jgi:hypothetical protein
LRRPKEQRDIEIASPRPRAHQTKLKFIRSHRRLAASRPTIALYCAVVAAISKLRIKLLPFNCIRRISFFILARTKAFFDHLANGEFVSF